MKVVRSGPAGTEVQRFEGHTFESVLRKAAAAGVLKLVCLEKQMTFLARTLVAQSEGGPGEVGGDHLAATTREEHALDARELDIVFPRLTASISALVHETQRERGTSSLYLSSGGRLVADELHGQWRRTDERRSQLAELRKQQASSISNRLGRQLDRMEEQLEQLRVARLQVKGLEFMPAQAIEHYSNTNSALLAIVDGLAHRAVGSAHGPAALAWMALLHAKEKTGIERAELASAFMWDRYADGQHAIVSALIAASNSYLHLFETAAPERAGDLLREKLHSTIAGAVAEMEQIAMLRRQGGFGIDPTAWFTTISQKMDQFSEVELVIRASLT